jgi:hypothetical protein
MSERPSDFNLIKSIVVSRMLISFGRSEFGRYETMTSCEVRPDKYSALIVHLCLYRTDVAACHRYPNADEAYLVLDLYAGHSLELQQARRLKLLGAGLGEYWALDFFDQSFTVFRGGARSKYRTGDRVCPESFPDVEIEVELSGQLIEGRE